VNLRYPVTLQRHIPVEGLMNQEVINRDPEILGGTPVFMGTRVPIRILFEHLEAGDNLDVFLDDFPSAA